MKKILIALAACVVSAAGMAQPMRPGDGPRMDRERMAPHRMSPHRMDRRHKVWVPAHREHGRRVPGHYVWR
jgi:Ni/Co efflux regulator RcnB